MQKTNIEKQVKFKKPDFAKVKSNKTDKIEIFFPKARLPIIYLKYVFIKKSLFSNFN